MPPTESACSEAEVTQLIFFYVSYLMALGKVVGVRQRAVNTAALLFRRFYQRAALSEADPLLLAPTALLIASKAEECYVSAAVIASHIPKLDKELGGKNPYREEEMLEQARVRLRRGAGMCRAVASVAGERARLWHGAGGQGPSVLGRGRECGGPGASKCGGGVGSWRACWPTWTRARSVLGTRVRNGLGPP